MKRTPKRKARSRSRKTSRSRSSIPLKKKKISISEQFISQEGLDHLSEIGRKRGKIDKLDFEEEMINEEEKKRGKSHLTINRRINLHFIRNRWKYLAGLTALTVSIPLFSKYLEDQEDFKNDKKNIDFMVEDIENGNSAIYSLKDAIPRFINSRKYSESDKKILKCYAIEIFENMLNMKRNQAILSELREFFMSKEQPVKMMVDDVKNFTTKYYQECEPSYSNLLRLIETGVGREHIVEVTD